MALALSLVFATIFNISINIHEYANEKSFLLTHDINIFLICGISGAITSCHIHEYANEKSFILTHDINIFLICGISGAI